MANTIEVIAKDMIAIYQMWTATNTLKHDICASFAECIVSQIGTTEPRSNGVEW